MFIPPHRAQHQPPPSYLSVIPLFHHIRPRSQNEVNVIRHDRLTQQVDPEVFRLKHQLIVDPLLAMIIIRNRSRE